MAKLVIGINDFQTLYPNLVKEWDLTRNKISPNSISSKSHYRAWWKCKKGHKWQAVVSSRTSGTGCPYCSGRLAIPGENDLKTLNPELCKEWNTVRNIAVDPDHIKPNSDMCVWWICNTCGFEWTAKVKDRNKGSGCPNCNKSNRSSIPEKALFYYLHQVDSTVISGYKPDWIGRHGAEIDIFIPALKVGIEYDGSHWHKDTHKDITKVTKAKENGIRLIRVREPGCPSIDLEDVIYTDEPKSDLLFVEKMVSSVISYLNNNCNGSFSSPDINILRDTSTIMELTAVNQKEKSLEYSYPSIAREWNYRKNGKLTPDMVLSNSNRKVWWICSKCGFEWVASVNNRIRRGCPACSGKAVFVGVNDFATLYPEIAQEWDNEKNGDLKPSMITIGHDHKVWWKCSSCGYSWETQTYHRIKGRNCPACAGKEIWIGHNDFATLYPQLLPEWDYENNININPQHIFPGTNMRVWWKCSKCGHHWQTSVGNRTGRKSGCPKCAQQITGAKNSRAVRQYTTEGTFINEYPSISAAMAETGAPSIGQCCKHFIRSSGGFVWKYADEES